MIKKTLGAAAAALLGVSMLTAGGFAQDSTPSGSPGSCPTTTADENVQIVQDYMDAVKAGDADTADALLSDDFQHDLSTDLIDVPNEPGNADELERMDIAADVNAEVIAVVAQNDWVAIEWTFDITGEHIDLGDIDPSQAGSVDVMTFVRIECGEIAEAHFASDALRALLELGFEVTPPGEGQ